VRTLRRLSAAFALTTILVGAPAADAHGAPAWRNMLGAINEARSEHGLRPVRPATGLREAAVGHARDMLRNDYLAHTSPSGVTLLDRILRSPFVTFGDWSAAETLAWGPGREGYADEVVAGWLASPVHRAILFSNDSRWVGIARVRGSFRGHDDARVWTVDWAHR
jgi:uncharacterized protein YkwD